MNFHQKFFLILLSSVCCIFFYLDLFANVSAIDRDYNFAIVGDLDALQIRKKQ